MIKGIINEETLFEVLEGYSINLEKHLAETKNNSLNSEEYFEQLVDLLPKITHKGYLLNTIGLVFFQQNRLPEAIHYMEEAVKASPQVTQYKCNLGLLYYRLGEIEKAIKAIKDVDVFWMNGGNPIQEYEEFAKEYEIFQEEVLKITAEEEKNNVEAIYELAWFYADDERYYEAIKCFKQMLEIEPENFTAIINIANLSFEIGQVKRAKLYYLKAIKQEPDNYVILRMLSKLYIIEENYKKAATILKQALTYHEDDTAIIRDMAFVLVKLERGKEAIKYLRKSIEIEPESCLKIDKEEAFRELLKHLI